MQQIELLSDASFCSQQYEKHFTFINYCVTMTSHLPENQFLREKQHESELWSMLGLFVRFYLSKLIRRNPISSGPIFIQKKHHFESSIKHCMTIKRIA